METTGNTELNYCYNCMTRLESGQTICPVCGHDNSLRENPDSALPEGTILAGKYLVGKVLGQGGFGITYLGFDISLDIKVAVKEYFPYGIGVRAVNSIRMTAVSSQGKAEEFRKGCDEFQAEAKRLAAIDSPYIVKVREYFRENGTAYIIMNYLDGNSLTKEAAECGGKIPWQRVLDLFKPLILEMDNLHDEHLIHRDIKPDNIKIIKGKNGTERLVLLDFGAARSFVSAEATGTYSAMVTQGYAPVEQYSRKAHQGPYTDIYALCATMYAVITGTRPPQSNDRMMGLAELPAFSGLGIDVPENIEKAIFHGLEVRSEDRPRNMRELFDELNRKESAAGTATAVNESPSPMPRKQEKQEAHSPSEKEEPKKKANWLLPVLLAVLLAAGVFLWRGMLKDRLNTTGTSGTNRASAAKAELEQTLNALQKTQEAFSVMETQTSIQKTQQAMDLKRTDAAANTTAADPTDTAALTVPVIFTNTVIPTMTNTPVSTATSTPKPTDSPDKLFTLGEEAYINGDYGKALKYLLPAAEAGHAGAQYRLGKMYDDGDGTEQSYEEAVRWYRQAAGQGNAYAQNNLGVMYANGKGVEQSDEEAVRWYQLAADQGDADAQSNLGVMCANGKGTDQSYEEAVRWFQLAAGQGNAKAQYNLGVMYANGKGVGQSNEEAVRWFQMAADQGHESAQNNLKNLLKKHPELKKVIENTSSPITAVKAGNIIRLGHYEQDGDLSNGAEAIEWQVLAVEDDRALVISIYGLDTKPYNEKSVEVTWETCTLRAWLNGEFFKSAFSKEEKGRIQQVRVKNPDNAKYGTKGGNDTTDRIFLLNIREAEKYFANDEARRCIPTTYAKNNGAYISEKYGNTSWWWLRSPGFKADLSSSVYSGGNINIGGNYVYYNSSTVRPAFWLVL